MCKTANRKSQKVVSFIKIESSLPNVSSSINFQITTANGSSKAYTGTELMSPNSLTADNYMVLTLTTSAVVSFSGFSASFSPGMTPCVTK